MVDIEVTWNIRGLVLVEALCLFKHCTMFVGNLGFFPKVGFFHSPNREKAKYLEDCKRQDRVLPKLLVSSDSILIHIPFGVRLRAGKREPLGNMEISE